MGEVYSYDQAHWSTMRMLKESVKWCAERSRHESEKEHKDTLRSLIALGREAA